MPLDNFSGDESSTSTTEPKTTYYQFENPAHEDSKEFDDPEHARRQFKAARYVQDRLGTDRHNLVGEFLIGVMEAEQNDNPDHLQEVVERIVD